MRNDLSWSPVSSVRTSRVIKQNTFTIGLTFIILLQIVILITLYSLILLDSGTGEAGEPVMILSKIVSVFTKNIKNRYLSQRLNLTLKHLALQQGISKVCCSD